MNVTSDSLTYFIVTKDIICFVGHKLFLGPEKRLSFVRSRLGPASNLGFVFTENLHCALTPSQLN
jgi:hypothetical protein